MTNPKLRDLIELVRPTPQAVATTDAERAEFLYDLVREVYEHVKFDVYGPDADTEERTRIGQVLDAALPPTSADR